MYRRFGGKREFKRYLHGHSDAGTKFLFKFRSRTHGLNEGLDRHSDRESSMLYGAESVVLVLWGCSAYSACREILGTRSESC